MRRLPRFAMLLAATAVSYAAPVERDIRPGDIHTYRVAVGRGQFLHVTAEQLGSDISIRLVQPDGTQFAEVDRLPYSGYEDLPWIASSAGECLIEIRAAAKSKPGRYRFEAIVRDPSSQDQSRAAGFMAAWIEAPKLRAQQTAANLRQAAARFDSAAARFHQAADPRWEAYALYASSEILVRLGEYLKARPMLERSLDLRRNAAEPYSLGVTLNGLGMVSTSLGDTAKAIEYYRQAIGILRDAGDKQVWSSVLNNLGSAYRNLSQFEKALECFNESLTLRRELGDRAAEATTLGNIASVYFHSGDDQSALERFSEAWKIGLDLGDRRTQAVAASGLADVYYAMGHAEEAAQFYKQAEARFREIGDRNGLARSLYSSGLLEQNRQNHTAAIRRFEEALAVQRETLRKPAVATALVALCRSEEALRQTSKAEAHVSEAMALSRESSDRAGIASAGDCQGRIDLAQGNLDSARRNFTEAVTTYREIGRRAELAGALAGLAETERSRGDLVAALGHWQESQALTESDSALLSDPDLRAFYRSARAGRVQSQIDLLMEMHGRDPDGGYAGRAFRISEQSRGRSLAEMIGESRDGLRQEMTAPQRQREDTLLRAIASTQRVLFRPGVSESRQKELKEQLSFAERDLVLFRGELHRGGSRYAAAQTSRTLDAQDVRRMLAAGTVLVEYALGEKRSFGWAVTENGLLSAVMPDRRALETSIERYRKLLAAQVNALSVSSALAKLDEEGRKLYQALVAPFEPALKGKTRVVIVPDGALCYLPFEALVGPGRMIDGFNISYTPSASTLAALEERRQRRNAPERALLAFADPAVGAGPGLPAPLAEYRERGFDFTPLPSARAEVTGIRALFAPGVARVYIGADARERTLKAEKLDSFRYIHFAAHGYFDEEHPLRSGIVLSADGDPANDGILQTPEIMRLRLNADLVTLSACQSGLGKVLAGEGVMGMPRAFFYAGAQSLVVSLWNVNDAATASLMKSFYANLKAGMPRDEALRHAKLALMKSSAIWKHPHFWAPFVFVGLDK